jgi:rare lipoprotein A
MPIPSYARVTNLDNGRSMIVRVNDRGPYARNRIIDVSIGAANALGFYGNGLAHVRVEYVGRAPLEGSDDRVLLATLREGGRSAPVPSQLMVASAAPFVPSSGAEAGGETPIPTERPFALGAGSGRVAAKPAIVNVASASPSERSVLRLPPAEAQKVTDSDSAPLDGPSPVAAYATAHNDATLGFMSGRGLY